MGNDTPSSSFIITFISHFMISGLNDNLWVVSNLYWLIPPHWWLLSTIAKKKRHLANNEREWISKSTYIESETMRTSCIHACMIMKLVSQLQWHQQQATMSTSALTMCREFKWISRVSVCQPNNSLGPLFLCCSVVFGPLLSLLSYISLPLSFYYLYLESTFWIRHHEFLELWVRRFSTSAWPRIVLITASPMSSLGSKRKQASKTKSTTSLPSKPLFLCYPYVTHMLVKGNFKTIIELPKYVDVNEWLAFNSKLMPFSSLQVLFSLIDDIASISFRVLQLYQHVLFIHHWFLQRTKLPFNVRRSRVSWHRMDRRDDGIAFANHIHPPW